MLFLGSSENVPLRLPPEVVRLNKAIWESLIERHHCQCPCLEVEVLEELSRTDAPRRSMKRVIFENWPSLFAFRFSVDFLFQGWDKIYPQAVMQTKINSLLTGRASPERGLVIVSMDAKQELVYYTRRCRI